MHEGHALLWPGDLEQAGEELLLKDQAFLKSIILKAPHHGSKTSSSEAFIDAVDPAYVIYSTGRDNRFRFPHEEVVNRYKSRHIESYNTATNGEITLSIGKEGLFFKSFVRHF